MPDPASPPSTGLAVVIGASGGIGAALQARLLDAGWDCIGFSRSGAPALDLLDEASIAACAAHTAARGAPQLVIDATGVLHNARLQPEKSWCQIDPAQMAESFAVNAIGPALLIKHFLPLLPKQGRAVFATLSARVASIADNRLGGWYSYRASKAALNQITHTAAIELRRRSAQAICVALHPGTVDTGLSQAFARQGLQVQTPAEAAAAILDVLRDLRPEHSGGFFSHRGEVLPW